jgi:hypothetical protein
VNEQTDPQAPAPGAGPGQIQAPAEPPSPASEADRSTLAHVADPSLAPGPRNAPGRTARPRAGGGATRGGVEWVRLGDLLTRLGMAGGGRAVDWQAIAARRTRRAAGAGAAASRRGIARAARRLPPLSAFGQARPARPGVSRTSPGGGPP